MNTIGARPVLLVGSNVIDMAQTLRAEGRSVTMEPRGPAAAALLEAGGSIGNGILVLDLALPELDRQRLRAALGEAAPAPESLEAVERRQIATMLRYTGGNRRKAAQLLGLARSTLLAKIRRYELESPGDMPVELET